MRPLSPFKPYGSTAGPPSPSKSYDSPGSTKGKGKAAFVDVVIEGADDVNDIPDGYRLIAKASGLVICLSNPQGLNNTLNELLSSERNYVKRLQHLHTDYAVPLRTDARSDRPVMVKPYDVNGLFSNLDRILALNVAFLHDLQLAIRANDGSWAQTCRHHLAGFEPYAAYISGCPNAQAIEKRLTANPKFAQFCGNVQYGPTTNVGGAGLRELLAEPFQRIARYPLLLNEMVKHLASDDPLLPVVTEASELAANIARDEAGELARKAAEMHTVASAIVGFPPELINPSRHYVSCIDVKDVPLPQAMTIGPTTITAPSSLPSSSNVLHATLFLFSDLVVVAKRPTSDTSRALVGLDRNGSVTATTGSPASPRKNSFRTSGLQFRGAFRLSDVTAVDEGSSLGLHLEDPPSELSARWNGRPARRFLADANEKRAFLLKFWTAQGLQRKRRETTVLQTSTTKLAIDAGMGSESDDAHVFFTVYLAPDWLREADKGKTVLRLDARGIGLEPLRFDHARPHVVLEAAPVGMGEWEVDVRHRGAPAAAGKGEVMTDAGLAWEAARSALRFGVCDVPPRYTQALSAPSPILARSRSPTSSSARLQNITDVFGIGAGDGHRRTKSSASKASTAASSIFSGSRTSTMASSVRSGASRPPVKLESEGEMEVLASTPADPPIKRSTSADTMSSRGPDEPARVAGLARSQSDQSMQSSILLASPSKLPQAGDVFGSPSPSLSPLSPRSNSILHGPRPSPSQRRKPVPQLDGGGDAEMHDSSDDRGVGDTSTGSVRGKRPRDETPLSPTSSRQPKRAVPGSPQRASTTQHSPAVRSPLGRHSPTRRAVSAETRRSSPDRLMQEIDEAIEEAEGRKASIVDIKQRVQTFTLPPSTAPGTPKGVVARSGAAPGGSGLTRSPQVYDISAQAKPKPTEGSLEAFQASVFEALDALLGETEGMTRRWRDVAAVVEGYRAEKVTIKSALSAKDRRIVEVEAANASLKKEVAEAKRAHGQLDVEVKEIYNAVNAELDSMFDDSRLPVDERLAALQREIKRRTADEVLLRYRIAQLEAANAPAPS